MKYRSTKTLVLLSVLLVLLVTLAALQYRWLGQVSTGERERMQASLHSGALRFSQDFNREITRAYLSFQMDMTKLQDEKARVLAERFEQWNANAPYPRLVSDLYLLDKSEQSVTRFSHFNRTLGKFEPAEWPGDFAGLRKDLEHGISNVTRGHELVRELSINPVEPNIPALVSPILGTSRILLSNKENGGVERKEGLPDFADVPPFAGYLIIKLDIDVITKELIPNLARRYFSGNGGLEYNLAVINLRQSEKAIYRSDSASQNPQPINGDATARLMDIQPEQLDALWFGLPRRPGTAEGKSTRIEQKIPRDNVVVRTDTQSEKGTANTRSVTVRVFNRDMKELAAVDKSVEAGPWQLLIQHRAGSLEAAVTSTRRRNLVISFGVLVLLAGSMAMIVVSTRRAERLANRQMEFVSSVSHEFRTPLSVICSAGENLADGVIEGTHQTKKYGELIRNEGRRLTEMVEQVLEFAGARSRHRSYQFRPVKIASVIDDALTSYQPVIVEKGYVIQQEIDPNLPLVEADSAAIRRSLQNLLSNAMKYESDRRWIGIRAKAAATSAGEEVQVIIEDQGIGIGPDDVSHVFEPFYRGREVVEAQIHGNGLGLSLVKEVVEAHHGTVSVISEQGKGSTFTLHLPVLSAKSDINSADVPR